MVNVKAALKVMEDNISFFNSFQYMAICQALEALNEPQENVDESVKGNPKDTRKVHDS